MKTNADILNELAYCARESNRTYYLDTFKDDVAVVFAIPRSKSWAGRGTLNSSLATGAGQLRRKLRFVYGHPESVYDDERIRYKETNWVPELRINDQLIELSDTENIVVILDGKTLETKYYGPLSGSGLSRLGWVRNTKYPIELHGPGTSIMDTEVFMQIGDEIEVRLNTPLFSAAYGFMSTIRFPVQAEQAKAEAFGGIKYLAHTTGLVMPSRSAFDDHFTELGEIHKKNRGCLLPDGSFLEPVITLKRAQ